MKAQNTMSTEEPTGQGTAQSLRPQHIVGRSAQELVDYLINVGHPAQLLADTPHITGITMDSREVQSGDLYVAIPGAQTHGAKFVEAAINQGASAILTDTQGLEILKAKNLSAQELTLGVIRCEELRELIGPLSGYIYQSQPQDGSAPTLFAVTGTNGKTTTTYMVNSIMQSLGNTTGLIGTIEILAGQESIPSKLTTPESPHVHSLIALMRERGIGATSMEVSSHALDYRRVDGIRYDVSGFTNLTQDHLDLHGDMESYCASKAELFTPERSARAVITVDDAWGEHIYQQACQAMGADHVVALYTNAGAGYEHAPTGLNPQDWVLLNVERHGIGHRFTVVRTDGTQLNLQTQLPADFNVSNASLAAVMVYESGHNTTELEQVLQCAQTLTPVVPGRMQLIGEAPTAIVDFAHNPDALKRALEAVHPAEQNGRVIIVFGATGNRDQTKRPIMGSIAAQYADIVIVTDDDPHDEDPTPIRQAVVDGAEQEKASGARAQRILNISPRADAIDYAFSLAGKQDSVLIAGRGHETAQDIAGVDIELDDRVEVARALNRYGYSVLADYQLMLEA